VAQTDQPKHIPALFTAPHQTHPTARLNQFSVSELRHQARHKGIFFRTGPFVTHLKSDYGPAIDLLVNLYGESEYFTADTFANFHIRLHRPYSFRRWIRPQIQFSLDGRSPFEPFPLEQALPLFEWGMNWCIAMDAHRFLMLHSAVVEKNGQAIILPALPGSGKSTLCSVLAHRGWRLLSDEFGMIEPKTGLVWPLPKAIPIKNKAIPVVRDYLPEAWMGPEFHGTRKGTVSHVKPPADSLIRQNEPARPRCVVFPKYRANAETRMEPVTNSSAFTRLANNSFNYVITGEAGFRSLSQIVQEADCFNFEYSNLDEAISVFSELATS